MAFQDCDPRFGRKDGVISSSVPMTSMRSATIDWILSWPSVSRTSGAESWMQRIAVGEVVKIKGEELEVVSIGPPEKGVKYPVCLAGERACPLEDSGGPWCYDDFLDAIRDPDHEEHEEMKMK